MAEFIGNRPFFSCRNCRTAIALRKDLLSKNLWVNNAPAFMAANVMNVALGGGVYLQLLTGKYSIAPIYCCSCMEEVGWKYLQSYDPAQKYKEGRFVIKKPKIVKEY